MSDIQIEMTPNKSLRLMTAGKYCDKNILVTLPFTIITPAVAFNEGKLYAPSTAASFSIVSCSDYDITFQYKGASGCEELLFPIKNLSPGAKYTISFEETYNGGFIEDTYVYGCGIIQKSTHDSTSWPSNIAKPSWVTWSTASAGTQSGTITFTANSDMVYWGWALSRLKDNVLTTISIKMRLHAA